MKNNYDQLNLEYIETKKVSSFLKFTSILFILIFAFIPLAEFVNALDYHYATAPTFHGCIVGLSYEPLQFKLLPSY